MFSSEGGFNCLVLGGERLDKPPASCSSGTSSSSPRRRRRRRRRRGGRLLLLVETLELPPEVARDRFTGPPPCVYSQPHVFKSAFTRLFRAVVQSVHQPVKKSTRFNYSVKVSFISLLARANVRVMRGDEPCRISRGDYAAGNLTRRHTCRG